MLNYLLLFSLLGVSVCQQKKPNVVLILTDDQDVVLGGMTPMKSVQRFIGNEGVTFTNSYVTSPICCPSRASLLTGLYQHNHYTINNSLHGGCYGLHWRQSLQNYTFATALKDAGYKTFYAGKYLNEYGSKDAGGPEVVPPGWTEWHGLVGNSVYYNYTISNNGVPTASNDQYLTDVIRELGVSYIENQTEQELFLMVIAPPAPHKTSSTIHRTMYRRQHINLPETREVGVSFIENQTEEEPFLMVLAPPAPHQPFTPAPRHEGKFSNVTAVRHPNFNIAAEDKHWLMRMRPSPLPASMIPELDRVYRSRWESLLAVDEMVADIVGSLERQALLDNTYILFTSDNGYHVGQFSQMYDKRQPYESDIKVPLLIKGPGIKRNSSRSQPILNIDLAPTIIQLAGLEPPAQMDGRAIDLVKEDDGVDVERYMLVEYQGEGRDGSVDENCPWKYDGEQLAECYPQYDCKCQDSRNNTYACLRHFGPNINMKYCEFTDKENFVEIYNLARDPFELSNAVNAVLPAVKHWNSLLLARMRACVGAGSCDHPLTMKTLED